MSERPFLKTPDPDAIVARVLGCPSVVAMSPGRNREVATYLPHRRVLGVRVVEEEIEVHIVARRGISLLDAARQVQEALAPLAESRVVSVYVDDIESPYPNDDDPR